MLLSDSCVLQYRNKKLIRNLYWWGNAETLKDTVSTISINNWATPLIKQVPLRSEKSTFVRYLDRDWLTRKNSDTLTILDPPRKGLQLQLLRSTITIVLMSSCKYCRQFPAAKLCTIAIFRHIDNKFIDRHTVVGCRLSGSMEMEKFIISLLLSASDCYQ